MASRRIPSFHMIKNRSIRRYQRSRSSQLSSVSRPMRQIVRLGCSFVLIVLFSGCTPALYTRLFNATGELISVTNTATAMSLPLPVPRLTSPLTILANDYSSRALLICGVIRYASSISRTCRCRLWSSTLA